MNRNRIIWLVLWILSLVGISFFGGNITYSFFFVMTFIPVFSLLYLLYVYTCFRIYQYTDRGDFVVNDAVPYSFKLINEFHLPFVAVRVRFFEPFSTINDLNDEITYELMPGTGITRETTLVCHYRGEYEIGIKEVEIQDYFRLLKIKYHNKECKRVTVAPQLVRLENLWSVQETAGDTKENPSKLDVISREYVMGDDIRFINWSQTARVLKPMVRESIGEEGNGVSVILDVQRVSEDPYIYLPIENKLLELTLAISLFYCNKKISSTEYHFSKILIKNFISNYSGFDEYYKNISSVSFDANFTQKELFDNLLVNTDIMNASLVYLVLSSWTEYAETMVNNLSKKNINSIVYIISEKETPKSDILRPDLVKIVNISPEAKLEEVIK